MLPRREKGGDLGFHFMSEAVGGLWQMGVSRFGLAQTCLKDRMRKRGRREDPRDIAAVRASLGGSSLPFKEIE